MFKRFGRSGLEPPLPQRRNTKAGGYDVEENLMRTERFEITVFPAGKKGSEQEFVEMQ